MQMKTIVKCMLVKQFVLSKNNNNSILVFKFRNNYYQVVIKTTTDKSENYLTSFIRSNEKEYNRY